MKAKEYYSKHKDMFLMSAKKDDPEIREYEFEDRVLGLYYDMQHELEDIIKNRHCVRDEARAAAVNEMNQRWNCFRDLLEKDLPKGVRNPVVRDWFRRQVIRNKIVPASAFGMKYDGRNLTKVRTDPKKKEGKKP